MYSQARILASVLFKRDMEVGRQDGHQPHPESCLEREETERRQIERMREDKTEGETGRERK